MKPFLRRRGAMLALDITPLMDIVFQLLLFFILTSAMLQPALNLDLPGSPKENSPAEADMVISVDAAGGIFMNGAAASLPELEGRLRSLAGENPDASVILQGDRGLSYGVFFTVLDTVRNTGIKAVNLAHEIREN